MTVDIRAQQLEAFERLLKGVPETQSPWKVLIYDRFSRDVVTTLANGKRSLWRDHNVTLKMLIDSPRERVADVSAVYFVLPTQENMSIIAKDASTNLYDSLHLHFSSPTSKESLEWLAKEVARLGGAVSIAKVWDQFLGFVSLERSLFSLNLTDTFVSINAAHVKEEDVFATLNNFTNGLTNALVTMGRVPIIRCERNGAAKEIAELLSQRIHQLLKDRSAFQLENTAVEQRPMLLILDRGSDMSTPLRHSEIYQVLADDLLGPIKLNRLEFVYEEEGVSKKHVYDLDAEVDPFWNKHAGTFFQQVIEEQAAEVKLYEEKAMQISKEGHTSASLVDVVSSLPELTEKKKNLANHGSLMRPIFEEIRKRSIPDYYDLENRMFSGRQAARAEKRAVLETLGRPSGHIADKLRLLIVFSLTAKLTVQELDEFEKAIYSTVDPGPKLEEAKLTVNFIRRVLSVSSSFSTTPGTIIKPQGATSSILSSVDFAFSTFQEKLQASVATAASAITGSSSWGPAARAIDAVCGGQTGGIASNLPTVMDSAEIDSQYLYFDPKIGKAAIPPNGTRFKGSFQKCILFVVGGGCYNEYHNLCKYSVQRKREVVYGATEIFSANEFLRQMRAST